MFSARATFIPLCPWRAGETSLTIAPMKIFIDADNAKAAAKLR
jgi:hypothetical protein